MTAYHYFPGCSLKGTGRAYEESFLAVTRSLDLDVNELDDWNCCGATAYMSTDELEATALAARNLAIAEREPRDVITPCNACYLVLNKALRRLTEDTAARKKVGGALESVNLPIPDTVRVRHPLDVLVNDVGLDTLKQATTRSLDGLKVAPYYGCQVVRPWSTFDDPHAPTTMDDVLKAVGAKVVTYPSKTRCCGASQTGTMPEIGLELVYALLKDAHDHRADVIATICPLCQFNLEATQDQVRRRWTIDPIPVVYVTQLLGWALGLSSDELGLQRAIVPVESLLNGRTADVTG
jgi:heterodisulfide reductase subunit B